MAADSHHNNNPASDNVYCYTGHINEKYTIRSTIYSNNFGNYILSGSEDGKVRCINFVIALFKNDSQIYSSFPRSPVVYLMPLTLPHSYILHRFVGGI